MALQAFTTHFLCCQQWAPFFFFFFIESFQLMSKDKHGISYSTS